MVCALTVFGFCWRTVPFEPRILLFGLFVALVAIMELVWWNRPSSYSPPVEKIFEEEGFDADAIQQIIRSRTKDGMEYLEGTFLVEFVPKQRTTSIHVPFCPAFETPPTVEALLLEGDATLSVVKPQPFGVRIDVKRQDDEPVRILVTAHLARTPTPS